MINKVKEHVGFHYILMEILLCTISAFASLVCVLVGTASSAVGIKICATTAGIKKCKKVIKKNRKSMINTVDSKNQVRYKRSVDF